jgi:hypothetical protein
MPNPDKSPSHYQHFILLLRQAQRTENEAPAWRLTLEDPRTGERKGFKGVDELAAFLKTWIAGREAGSPGHSL